MMNILESLGLQEQIPQGIGRGIPMDELKAQKESQEKIKYINDLQNANKNLKHQNDALQMAYNQNIETFNLKEKDYKEALVKKEFENTTLINAIGTAINAQTKIINELTKELGFLKTELFSIKNNARSVEDKMQEKFDELEVNLVTEIKNNAPQEELINVFDAIKAQEKNMLTETSKMIKSIPQIDQEELENRVQDIITAIVKTELPLVLENMKLGIIKAINESEKDNQEYFDECSNIIVRDVKEHIDSLTIQEPEKKAEAPKEDEPKEEAPREIITEDADIELSGDLKHTEIDHTTDTITDDTTKDTDIELKASTPIQLSPNQQRIVDYLNESPKKSNKEISEALNLDKANASRVLKAMVEKSIIVKNDDDTYELYHKTKDDDIEL